jgi:uncharacterized protein YggU (UPF0235/DUF167 family)
VEDWSAAVKACNLANPADNLIIPPMRLPVRAVPNSRTNEILGWEEDALAGRVLRVKIAAPAVDGKANAALREFLAGALRLSKSQVLLEKGGTSRIKMFTIPDGTPVPE